MQQYRAEPFSLRSWLSMALLMATSLNAIAVQGAESLTDAWRLAAKRGRDGANGTKGDKGDQGPPGKPGVKY